MVMTKKSRDRRKIERLGRKIHGLQLEGFTKEDWSKAFTGEIPLLTVQECIKLAKTQLLYEHERSIREINKSLVQRMDQNKRSI